MTMLVFSLFCIEESAKDPSTAPTLTTANRTP